jgi:cytoskeleton protein RodZ
MIEQNDKENALDDPSQKADLRVVSDRVSESYCSILKNGREKKGMSLRDLADDLKIPLKNLKALEEQQYDKLPADAYVKGYIRSYAALLGLNPEGLIKDFLQDKAFKERGENQRRVRQMQDRRREIEEQAPAFDKSVFSFMKTFVAFYGQHKFRLIAGLFFLAVLVLVALVYTNVNKEQAPDELNAIERVKVQSADGTVVVSDLMGEQKITPVVKSEFAEAQDRLKLVFSGASWVTVKDEQGNLLHQSRQQNGEVLEVSGQAPFYLRLSKASVVNLHVNGKAFDFSTSVSDDDQLHDLEITVEK